jgi:L-fuconolactonase
VQEFGRRGLVYDLLTKTPHMRAAINLVKACPDTKFVLDHISKPYIAKGEMQPWADQITELASFENVVVKVSGLFTEADWKNWKQSDFSPYLEHITKSFTPKRMMFGSDWPVCLLAATYRQTVDLIEEFTKSFSISEKNDFWASTANRIYNLKLI